MTFETKTYVDGQEIPPGQELPEGEVTTEEIDKRGLVEIISDVIGSPIDTEATLNEIWIKPELLTFPNRKKVQNMSTLQMLTYCKDYAVSGANPYAVNYFFWQDLAGWHFKSADLILSEYKDVTNEELPQFTLNSNIIGKERIYRFDVISDFSLYASLSNFSLYCYYERIDLNYTSPYARLMDDREKYRKKKIRYNYKDVYPYLYSVESADPFSFLTKEQIDLFENDQLLLNDVVFGEHSNRSFNDNDSIRSVLLMGDDIGTTQESGELIQITGESSDYSHFNSYETNKWQTMFDCTRLDGSTIKKIVNEIKQPTFRAKKEYRDKLAYKEKWNIYKYSVCCSAPDADEVLAVIKNFKTIGRNIYQYSWNEVVFIPKADLANFAGVTVDNTGHVFTDIQNLNASPINNSNLPSDIVFTKFGTEFTPETIGDLSGEIFIYGTTCGITYETNNSVSRAILNYLDCAGVSGATFNFHNDKYSPFLIVEKPNGYKGFTGTSSGAYNLNEIFNRTLYDESEYPQITTGSSSVIYHQGDVPDSPPVSDETDIIVGPGINANKQYTDYPVGFASMPVGTYQRINKGADGSPVISPDGSSVVCEPIPLGHIVKIKSVNTKDLPLYGIDIKDPGVKTIYYFNATNAQDGNCTSTIDCSIGDPYV